MTPVTSYILNFKHKDDFYYAVIQCPSVCHVGRLYPHAEDILKLLSRPDSLILVFLTPALLPNSMGNPFNGGATSQFAKYMEWEIFCDFRLKSPFISETVRDRLVIAM